MRGSEWSEEGNGNAMGKGGRACGVSRARTCDEVLGSKGLTGREADCSRSDTGRIKRCVSAYRLSFSPSGKGHTREASDEAAAIDEAGALE